MIFNLDITTYCGSSMAAEVNSNDHLTMVFKNRLPGKLCNASGYAAKLDNSRWPNVVTEQIRMVLNR